MHYKCSDTVGHRTSGETLTEQLFRSVTQVQLSSLSYEISVGLIVELCVTSSVRVPS